MSFLEPSSLQAESSSIGRKGGVTGIVGIVAVVGMAFGHIVSGTAAIASIVAICLKTDFSKIAELFKGK